MKLHEAGNLAQARTGFERILKKNPREVNALHYLGVVLHQQGQHEKGARLIQKAIEIYPKHWAAYSNLGGIFYKTGQFANAERAFRKVIELQPSDVRAYINLCNSLSHLGRDEEAINAGRTATILEAENKHCWLSLANALRKKGQYESAIECYEKAIALDPKLFEAHGGLCHCISELEIQAPGSHKRMEKTAMAYRNWLNADPGNPVASYQLAAIEGNDAFKRSPDEFVSVFFDQFAETFDRNLADLEYSAPRLIAERVGVRLGQPGASLDVLDAGCGTGLLAAGLRPFARSLTGVDLSSRMLEKARARNLYDRLERAELTGFLKGHPACFDLLILADTLIYFGELEELIRAMEGSLRSGGIAICTLERLEDDAGDYRLNPHGRFSHHEDYLKRCLSAAGLSLVSCLDEVIRKERGQEVSGMLIEVLKA